MTTSYIVPIHNSENTLNATIENLIFQIKKHNLSMDEILLIENGSTDNSWNKICKLEKKYDFIKKRKVIPASYGQAIKHGLLSSNCKQLYVINIDGRTITTFLNSRKLKIKLHQTSTKHNLLIKELLFKTKQNLNKLKILDSKISLTHYPPLLVVTQIIIDLLRLFFFQIYQCRKATKKIVADDYGISQTVNNAIIDQLKAKSITHVSVFANIVSKHDLDVLKKITNDSQIIAHINLLRGKPVLKAKYVPSLIKKDGKFFNLPQLLLKLLLKKISIQEIENEIQAQLSFFYKNNIKKIEINSEQHLYAFEPIQSIIDKLAKKNNIHHIRSIYSIENYLKPRLHKYLIYLLFSKILKFVYKPAQIMRRQNLDLIVHPGSNYG